MSGERQRGIDKGLLIIAGVNVAICSAVAELVNTVVQQPYLDEEFHIPQAQQYCRGDYNSYDPKLTTPPGLYYLSIAYARILYDVRDKLPMLTELDNTPCHSIPQLRYTSLMALLLMPWLLSLYKVDGKIALSARPNMPTLETHIMTLLPPLWFFGFLYYTDVPSTVLVIACLLAAKKKKHLVASLLGCASLTLRQTNIVWVSFAMGTSLLTELRKLGLEDGPLVESSSLHQLRSISQLPFRKVIAKTVSLLAIYSPVAILSVAFILQNGRIVLGDQDNHKVSIHWVQPLYCVSMMTFFGWPALLPSQWKSFKSPSRWLRSVPSLALLSIICLAAIHYGTIAHPFLLADNRHYTFYIWRRVIDRTEWSRYALAPIYSLMLKMWWNALSQNNSLFWIAGFSLCTCAAIIPSPLIEPRYFLLPFLIARLHLFPDSGSSIKSTTEEKLNRGMSKHLLAVEGVWFASINAITMYLFLYRPFRWPDSLQWQRFMW